MQAEIERRKGIGRAYSGNSIFSSKIVCACCGGFFGSKVWHSTSKYKRTVWQCNHKFKNGEKCGTPHLYEDEIKKRFVSVCRVVGDLKDEFIVSCRDVIEILSDCTALDKRIRERYDHLNCLAKEMQEFIRVHAMSPQEKGVYEKKTAEYEEKRAEGEAKLLEVKQQKVERMSRRELLIGMVDEIEKNGVMTADFDEKLWRLIVEKVTVNTDGSMVFTLRNGMEIRK